MGNTDSKIKVEKAILRHPATGEASDFYWACRDGDIERVKQMLPTIPFNELNCLEPNGSTALHAASYCGHTELVCLLLHVRGCKRDQRNRYGLTAYEEAYSDEIRQLFHRPQGSRNRFCDEENDASDMFAVKTDVDDDDILGDGDDEVEKAPNNEWVECISDAELINLYKEFLSSLTSVCNSAVVRGIMALSRTRLIKHLVKRPDGQGNYRDPLLDAMMEDINQIIIEKVTNQHPTFDKCNFLIDECVAHSQIEQLLHLYTLETPLYGELREHIDPLFFPILISLGQFAKRYFQGISYRGLTMSEDDLRAYRWTLKHKSVIVIKTFCSTSLKRETAEAFASPSFGNDNQQRVLMVLQFNQKCVTAINLCKISDELPCISEYENEAEVLILPYTCFTVTRIETRDTLQIIYLENFLMKSKSFLSGFKWLYTNRENVDSI